MSVGCLPTSNGKTRRFLSRDPRPTPGMVNRLTDRRSPVDGGDRAFLELASELDLAMAERDVRELRELDAAWERLENGRFGTCVDCGNPIAMARLQANPAAARCNPCQTQMESAHPEQHHRL